MREKLIELLYKAQDYGTKNTHEENYVTIESKSNEKIADHLIANGVTLDNQVSSSKWIPVSEKRPKAGEDVLAVCWWHETWNVRVCYLSVNNPGCWYTSVSGQWTPAVTHWMPLPEPPKEEE